MVRGRDQCSWDEFELQRLAKGVERTEILAWAHNGAGEAHGVGGLSWRWLHARLISGLTCCSGTMGAGAGTHTTPSPTRHVLSRPPVAGNDTSYFFFSFDSKSQDQEALAALDEGKGAGG